MKYVRLLYYVSFDGKLKYNEYYLTVWGDILGLPSFPQSALIVEWMSNIRVGEIRK